MADKVRLRKGTSLAVLQKRLKIPYVCVQAMPLLKGAGYDLLDEPAVERRFEGMGTQDNKRLFCANLVHVVPKGEYSVEQVKNIYRLRKTG